MIYRLLKLNHRIKNHRLKYLGVAAARFLGMRYLSVRLDPLVACNLSCLMCPFTAQRRQGSVTQGKFSPAELDRLARMIFPRTLQLVVGCSYEPTIFEGFEDIVALGKRHGVPRVGLTTNGQLLTSEMMARLNAAGLDEITVSTHGAEQNTYESLMAGASFSRLHEALGCIAATRGRQLKLRLNFTACRENLHDMPRLLEVFGAHEPDVLQVRPMFGRNFSQGMLSDDDVSSYLEYAEELVRDCRRRGITLLISREDPRFERKNYSTLIMPAVYIYADPHQVWRKDFDWPNETYDEYCRRTGFMGQLLRNVFVDRDTLLALTGRFADSAGYEIFNA